MILTVTLNPAWDITHSVPRLEPGTTHRPACVAVRPGGKGVNVSRVLAQLGHPTLATGIAAGAGGERLRRELSGSGIPEAFFTCDVATEIRRTVTIVEAESGRATVLSEPGQAAGAIDWPALLRHLDGLIADAHVVVLSGSLPAGIPPDAYRVLVERAHARGVPAIVDADAAALRTALAARPDLVKPNTAELRAVTGDRDPVTGGRQLLHAGAAKVVVSDGPGGLTGLDAHATWRAVPAPLGRSTPRARATLPSRRSRWTWPAVASHGRRCCAAPPRGLPPRFSTRAPGPWWPNASRLCRARPPSPTSPIRRTRRSSRPAHAPRLPRARPRPPQFPLMTGAFHRAEQHRRPDRAGRRLGHRHRSVQRHHHRTH